MAIIFTEARKPLECLLQMTKNIAYLSARHRRADSFGISSKGTVPEIAAGTYFLSGELMSTNQTSQLPKGWQFGAKNVSAFSVSIQDSERVGGAKTVSVISSARARDDMGYFYQDCAVSDFLGKRIKMTAWVKTDLSEGYSQLYVAIHGIWRSYHRENGTFDNMWPDRLIRGKTGWMQYALVVDVPENSTSMSFGMYLSGIGQTCLEDIQFEIVDRTVALTGKIDDGRRGPANLDFAEGPDNAENSKASEE
jgi:hypothetical protein